MYATVKAALLAQIAANTTGLVAIAGNEPESIEGVGLYCLLRGQSRSYLGGGEVTVQYQLTARLAVPLGTNVSGAEDTLDTYVNAVPAALDLDPTLGGHSYEPARCQTATTGFWDVTGAMDRTMDFALTCAERGPLGTL